jgi:hypothetical protein
LLDNVPVYPADAAPGTPVDCTPIAAIASVHPANTTPYNTDIAFFVFAASIRLNRRISLWQNC